MKNTLIALVPLLLAPVTKLLEQIIADGRSTPGAKQANEVPVQIRKKADEGSIPEDIKPVKSDGVSNDDSRAKALKRREDRKRRKEGAQK